MKKEFIPYEQALALKELGFDAQCFAHYRDKESLVACNQGIYGISYSDIEAPTKVILAPLYQQAFRWFREKYNVHMYPTKYDETKWWVNWATWTSNVFDTFEEAEFECLKKLIEIAKNE